MANVIDYFDTTTGTTVRSDATASAGWFPGNPRLGQTATVSAHVLALFPFITGARTLHVHQLAVAPTQTTFGAAVVGGIYASDSTWVPASLIVQAGTFWIPPFSNATVPAVNIATSVSAFLPPYSVYWGATLCSTRTNIRVEGPLYHPPWLGWNSSLTLAYVGLVASCAFGTLPASFNVNSATFNFSGVPFVGMIVTQ